MNYFVEVVTEKNNQKFALLLNEKYEIVEEVLLFLNHLKIKKMAYNTIESYCRCLKSYYNWLSISNLNYEDVDKRNIIDFIRFLDEEKNKPKAANTINKYLAAVSSFYDYHANVNNDFLNPLKNLNSNDNYLSDKHRERTKDKQFFKRKVPKNIETKRLFPNQIVEFYDGIEHSTKYEEIKQRNKLIYRLLYETGMRISECLGLRLTDYSQPDPIQEVGFIYIRKHKNIFHKDHSFKTLDRKIPVSMDLIYELDNYVSYVRPKGGDYDTVFVNHRGSNRGRYIIRKTITKFFIQVSESTGVHCTPHKLRHTHGTELMENGYEQEYIQHRLGHSSLDSTNKYIHISLEAQTEAYEKFMESRERK